MHRPSYPRQAIDAVLRGMGPADRLAAADIGAGTGISSRLLTERGVRTYAIEPNTPMREEGERSGEVLLSWHGSTGEATGLPDESVDLVLCAQAYHWLNETSALKEFRRILRRPRGRVALMWNIPASWDPVVREYQQAIQRYATDPPASPWFRPPTVSLDAGRGFSDCRHLLFSHAQEFALAAFVGRALSSSYCPTSGPAHDALVIQLGEVFERHQNDGRVRFPYRTELFLAALP